MTIALSKRRRRARWGWVGVCLGAVVALPVAAGWSRHGLAEEEPAASGPASSLAQNVPLPTLGGTQFWADELFFHQWRIQRNAVTEHCRLLDPNNVRRAWGTFQTCRRALEGIRRERKLPAMRGKGVVVLHGLGRTRASMGKLCDFLQQHGGYAVFNVGYPSTRRGIGEHARALARIIENLDGIEQINFVAHSMGNIVIRRYLADQSDEAGGRRPDPRIKRFVMIGPPNHGSIAATKLDDSGLVATVLGKPSQQLGDEWPWLESSLATPAFEFGIVAGGMGNDQGLNPMLPGDDDGVVTVASTRLAGASDFVVVPVLHSLLVNDARVLRYTLRFLQHGHFVSADRRQPVGE